MEEIQQRWEEYLRDREYTCHYRGIYYPPLIIDKKVRKVPFEVYNQDFQNYCENYKEYKGPNRVHLAIVVGLAHLTAIGLGYLFFKTLEAVLE